MIKIFNKIKIFFVIKIQKIKFKKNQKKPKRFIY
jgi:hypothetical protein